MADRLAMVDASGKLYDGDQLIYLIARHRKRAGDPCKGVVGTQMSNLALEQALVKLKIAFARAKVGDRYVLEMLADRGWLLGGENSGHILCLDKHSTGDGIISSLQVLRALVESRTTLEKTAGALTLFPQVLLNVAIDNKNGLLERAEVTRAVAAAQAELGGAGRILLRPSGTEPVVRVMVESRNGLLARKCAESIVAAIKHAGA
jgi:phosphoglucosamine mutase